MQDSIKDSLYEYGYTISVGGETKEFVLGEITENYLSHMQRQCAEANKLEMGPNIRGVFCKSNTVYWVRQKKSCCEDQMLQAS